MFPIGQIVGGIIITYLLGMLADWAIFKRTSMSRSVGIIASSVLAVLVAVVLYGFGNANGGPWNPGNGPIAYGLGGAISGVIRWWRANAKGELDEGELAED